MTSYRKYESEQKIIPAGNATITITNHTPVLSPKERDKRKQEIERQLFDVFSKYRDKIR